jgi:hypothetical protein
MAVDQTTVRRNLASKYVTAADAFMAAYEDLIDLDARATSAGLVFADSDFAGTANAHLDAATFTAGRAMMASLKTLLDAGAPARKDAINKLRP